MAAGRRDEARRLLLSHGWVIGKLFDSTAATETQLNEFVAFGVVGAKREADEQHNPAVNARAAELLLHGRLDLSER